MLDTPGIPRLKQIVRSRGWPGSLRSTLYPAVMGIISIAVGSV
jgi:hypothetical protein